MKRIFEPGATKIHHFTVKETDFATFDKGTVHAVCSTFALAREMEWSSRLFMLEITDPDEEGVGTMLEITHHSPAFLNEEVEVSASVESWEGHELICGISVKVKDRLIATGRTGQKILKRKKISQIFTSLGSRDGEG